MPPPKEDTSVWEAAHRYLKGEDLPEELEKVKDKLLSFAGSQLSSEPSSTRDVLRRVEAQGITTQQQYEAWDALRNQMTHGEDPLRKDSSVRDLIRKCDRLVMLIYRLIFHATGYSGRYTDQSTEGWPIKTFDP